MEIKAYPRADGSFGIRNKVLVLSTVGCANETAQRIAAQVPGAVFIPNTKGCGQIGPSVEIMRRSLVGFALNPNVFGVLVVGLGCETMQAPALAELMRSQTTKPVRVLTIQDEGGTLRALQKGIALATELVQAMAGVQRVPTTLASIILATNCGGSDATSGLSANPAVGYCSDKLVAAGGTVLLGETTELIGTEHILAKRAKDVQVRTDLLKIIQGLEADFVKLGIDTRGANPSPGNMKGGLSTLEEKALGGIAKGGTTPINQVVPYGVRPTAKGLVVMDTPGYDIESLTGMAAGGAQVCIFTTGRGNPIGNPLMPVLKLTGNHETYLRMEDNMDMDTSVVLQGTVSLEECGQRVLEELVAVCNGKLTKAEALGFGELSVYRNYEIWCTKI